MSAPLRDLGALLAGLSPERVPGVWVVAVLPGGRPVPETAAATIREAEGLTVVLPEADAVSLGLTPLFRGAWITLRVQSDLAAIGLTAAVSAALGEAGIACNMLAGAHHDHLLVPADRADEALAVLARLQEQASGDGRAG